MAKKLYYKIGEACKSLDIQPYVLRYWETEFPALKPNKSKSGQRVYSERDLEVIRRIKELLYDEGYTIAGAKKKLDSEGPIAAPPEGGEEDAGAATEAEPATPAAPRPKPKPKKARARKAAAGKGAARATPEPPPAMSPEVRKAVKKALADTRSLLALLDKKSG